MPFEEQTTRTERLRRWELVPIAKLRSSSEVPAVADGRQKHKVLLFLMCTVHNKYDNSFSNTSIIIFHFQKYFTPPPSVWYTNIKLLYKSTWHHSASHRTSYQAKQGPCWMWDRKSSLVIFGETVAELHSSRVIMDTIQKLSGQEALKASECSNSIIEMFLTSVKVLPTSKSMLTLLIYS